MSNFLRRLLGLGSSEEEDQGQGERNIGKYINIQEQPGSNGKLFWGDLINQEGIQDGGPTTHLLVPDGNGGYRQPTSEELEEILKEIEENRKKNKK
jgi:hypothetical protein